MAVLVLLSIFELNVAKNCGWEYAAACKIRKNDRTVPARLQKPAFRAAFPAVRFTFLSRPFVCR